MCGRIKGLYKVEEGDIYGVDGNTDGDARGQHVGMGRKILNLDVLLAG